MNVATWSCWSLFTWSLRIRFTHAYSHVVQHLIRTHPSGWLSLESTVEQIPMSIARILSTLRRSRERP
jgi:hypothetical protein